MAVAWRASAEAYNASTNSLTCNKPTGTADNDVMLAFAYCNAPSDAITAPAGWNVVETINTTITGRMTVYYKVASSEGSDYTFTFDNTQRSRLSIHSFSGGNTSSPINDSSVSANSASQDVTATAVTTTVDNCLLVFFAGTDTTTTVLYEPPSGMTERFDSGGVSGAASGHGVADVTVASAGSTGNKVGQCNYSIVNVAFLVALAPLLYTKTIAASTDATSSVGDKTKRIIAASAKATGSLIRKVTKTIAASVNAVASFVDLFVNYYYIERKEEDGGTYAVLTYTDDMEHTDTDTLVDGTKYWYRLRKYLGGGSYTGYSNEVYVVYVGAGRFFKTIAAVVNATSTVIRGKKKILSSASVSATTTMSRKTKRVIAASSTATTSVTDKTKRVIAASVNAVSSRLQAYAKTISASVKATAARIQAHSKTISAAVTAIATNTRELQEIIHTFHKTITASASAVASIIDRFVSTFVFQRTIVKVTEVIQKYTKRTGSLGRVTKVTSVVKKKLASIQKIVTIQQQQISKKLANLVDGTYVIVHTVKNITHKIHPSRIADDEDEDKIREYPPDYIYTSKKIITASVAATATRGVVAIKKAITANVIAVPSLSVVIPEEEGVYTDGYLFGGLATVTEIFDTDEYIPDAWSSKTDAPGPANWYLAATSILGKIYLVAGKDLAGTSYADNDEYSPDTWTGKTDLIAPSRFGHVAATLSSKGYVFTGYNAGAYIADTDEYVPDSWSSKTDISSNARLWPAATVISEKAYLFGGNSVVSQYSKFNYEYVSDTWTVKTELPDPGRFEAAASTIGGKGYCYGGRNSSDVGIKDCDEYDVGTNAWASKTDMPDPKRRALTALTLSGSGYIFAGRDAADLQDTDEYSPDAWTSKTDVPAPARRGHASAGL